MAREKLKLAVALTALGIAPALPAQDRGTAGDFDYYVLALSWQPNWCAREGRAREAEICETDGGALPGWLLHGLWPQYEDGYPVDCPTTARNPSRADTRAMAPLYGSSGLAWHQWNKHGRCTGLSADDYYALSQRAFDLVDMPDVLDALDRSVTLPATLIEEAFLAENPGWEPDMLTITCRDGYIAEARLCLTRDLEPRPCGDDVVRDCRMTSARFEPRQ